MAIYSCNMRSIGRTTHAAGTAGAHVLYVGREDAAPVIIVEHMPEDPQEARTWINQQEEADRKNARVIDKIRIALPRELDEQQRAEVVRDYMAEVSAGRVPWYAAIHQQGKDEQNPHVHIIVRDRDVETGKRVVRLSDSARDWKKAGKPEEAPVQWVRERWEHHANTALEKAGHKAQIDRRTLEAQGIDRKPTIHVGPQAQHIDATKGRPASKPVPEKSWRRTQYREETPYPDIDLGRTRRERNAEIVDFNLEKAARSKDFATRKWAEFEREQRHQDRNLENGLIADARKRSLEVERIKAAHRSNSDETRQNQAQAAEAAKSSIEDRRAILEGRADQIAEQERNALREAQNRFTARFMRMVDVTGRTRQAQDEAWEQIEEKRQAEGDRISEEIQARQSIQALAIKAQYDAQQVDADRERDQALRALEDRHADQLAARDDVLQMREAAREQDRMAMELQLDAWKKQGRQHSQSTTPPLQRRAANDSAVQPAQDFDRAAPLLEPDKAEQEDIWRQRERERQWDEWIERDQDRDKGQDYEPEI